MQLIIRYSLRSMNEAGRVTRRWFYWPLLIFRGGYGLLLGLAIAVVILRALIHALRPDLILPFWYLLIFAAVLLATIFGLLYKREVRKRLKFVAEAGAAQIILTNEGIETIDEKGVRNFSPWSTYSQFREGTTIFLLKLAAAKRYWPIPKDCLTDLEAASLRSILLNHLPEV